MKLVCACLIFALGASAQAQSSPIKVAARSVVDGLVTKDPGGEPVKKALIELIAENQAEGGDYTAVTGPDGLFRIEGILPGRYRLFVERTGLLEVEKHRARTDGRVLTLAAGQELKDVLIRLQAAAVVQGRVTDEDGEPMPNAQVAVLRQTYISGHSHFEQAGSERTNDLGEYRVAGLPAGSYYVCVSPPPDFKSLIEAAGAAATADRNAHDKPSQNQATSYQSIYYPGTPDRSAAAPIELHAGDDFPANFSLAPSPSLSIRGSVVNLPPRTTAAIMLQSRDFNLVLNGAEMHPDGSFVIHDVSPGAYTILATLDTPEPMTARQSLLVVANNIEGLRLVPQPGATIHGRLRFENKGNSRIDSSQIFLMLHPVEGDDTIGMYPAGLSAGEGYSQLAHVAPDGSFEWKGIPSGNYFVQLSGEAEADLYLKSASTGSRDVETAGLNINGGSLLLDVLASTNGASVDGVVADHKGAPMANAVIVAVPETRLRGRVDHFHKTVSDQSGHFTLHGVPPGDYTLYAWESVDGDAFYNPDFLKTYEAIGSALHVGEGDRKTMQLVAIPPSEE